LATTAALFLCLLLPTLLAAEEVVKVPNYYCSAGHAFTIGVPVKAGGASVEYQWFRGNAAVTAALPLPPNENIISYTIPDTAAFGDSVVFHFKYRLNDGCEEWTRGTTFLMSFPQEAPQPLTVSGSAVVCAYSTLTYSAPDVLGVLYDWSVPQGSGWEILTGQGTHRITVRAGTSAGTVSVLARNGYGFGDAPGTLNVVTVNPAPLLIFPDNEEQKICQNGSITPITYTWDAGATGASMSWSPSSGGLSYSVSGTTGTISGALSSFGAVSYTLTITSTCCSCTTTATGTITRQYISAMGVASFTALSCSKSVTSGGTVTFGAAQ